MSIEEAVRKMTYNPRENGIGIYNLGMAKQKLGFDSQYDNEKFCKEVNYLLSNPKLNAFTQLQRWRALGKQMIRINEFQYELLCNALEQVDRVSSSSMTNANKRWSQEDDELLIETVCKEDASLIEIAALFGRTPTAISNRISHLVGINRISTEIAGKFIGTIDGKEVDGNIKGTLRKE